MENINEEKIEDILSDEIDLEDSDSTEESNSESSDAVYYLSSGEALNTKETYEITAREKTKLVVLAGLAGSGKTTIINNALKLIKDNLWVGFILLVPIPFKGMSKELFLLEQNQEEQRQQLSELA